MGVRLLVVDDHHLWTEYVRQRLQHERRYEIVATARDGAEALTAATHLKPDVILLDIGLPTLNGIQVARRIATAAPRTRVLFLSEQRSPDVAEAAMLTGARGYVLKSDAGQELLPALDAVTEGRAYVSATLAGALAETSRRLTPLSCVRHHEVLLTGDDTAIVNAFAQFAYDGLSSGAAAIVLATPPHLASVVERLRSRTVDVEAVVAEGRFLPVDIDALLASCLHGDRLDDGRLQETSSALVATATTAAHAPRRRIVACGETAPRLWQLGYRDDAIRIEHLWDDLAMTTELDVFCGYSFGPAAVDAALIQALHDTHAHVVRT